MDASLEQAIILFAVSTLHHRLRCFRIGKLIETKSLQMHYVTNVEGKDPVVRAVVFDTKGASCGNLELLFYLQLAHLFEGLE